MSIKKTPIYWEEMRKMDAPQLRLIFKQCAEIDLAWAVDQAKCLAFNVRVDSEHGQVVREFCECAALDAMKEGDVDTALEAFQVAGEAPNLSEEESKEQAGKMRSMLDWMIIDNKAHALGTAVLLNARTIRNDALRNELTDFLIKHSEGEFGILQNIVLGSKGLLTEAQVEKLIESAAELADKKPYEASVLLCNMMDECDFKSRAQEEYILALQSALSENPKVLAGILKNEYGDASDYSERLRGVNTAFIVKGNNTLQ